MLTGEKNEETVSRVLCAVFCPRTAISLGRTFPSASSDLDPRASGGPPFSRGVLRGVALLFGLAPGGVCHAATVARRAVSSYLTFSPLPSGRNRLDGGVFSVALSSGSPPPGITRHPALRSPDFPPARHRLRARRAGGRLVSSSFL
jgi:hypothetical protein